MSRMEQAQKTYDSMVYAMVEKKTLLVTVEIEDAEQAEFLIKQLYGPKEERLLNVTRIGWDQETIHSKVQSALNDLIQAALENPV